MPVKAERRGEEGRAEERRGEEKGGGVAQCQFYIVFTLLPVRMREGAVR